MLNFLTQKSRHSVLAGFLGLVIGSTGTLSALSSVSIARAQETTPPSIAEPTPQPYSQPQPSQPPQYPAPRPGEFPRTDDFSKNGGQGSMPGFGNQGPSEEDRQRQEEEMEKRRQEMEKRGLEQMKRGMKQAASGVKRMKRDFERFAKKKVKVPEECTEALQKIENIVQAVNSAADMDAAQEAGAEDMPEIFETLNDCRMRLEMLSRVPQMISRVNRELKNLERQWTRAKKNPPADLADAVAEGEAALQAIKEARDRVQSLANEGNIDEIEGVLEDEVFGRFDDVGAAIRRLEAARNAKRFATQFNQRIREAERLIKQLKRQKKDTAELGEILADAKAQYEALKSLKVGSDEWEEAIGELAELEQSFAATAGGGEDMGTFFAPKPGQVGPELSVPKEFGF